MLVLKAKPDRADGQRTGIYLQRAFQMIKVMAAEIFQGFGR